MDELNEKNIGLWHLLAASVEDLVLSYWDNLLESKHNLDKFREPIMTLKGIQHFEKSWTYRKINYWESQGLINPSRVNGTSGWRKFSLVEVVLLRVIADLKGLGMSIEAIDTTVSDMTDKESIFSGPGMTPIETFLLIALCTKQRTSLLVFIKGHALFHLTGYILQWINGVEMAHDRYIHLPFSKYVSQVFEGIQPDKKVDIHGMEFFAWPILDGKLRKVMNIIENDKYEKIVITKSNGEVKTIKTVRRRRGKFKNNYLIDLMRKNDARKFTIHFLDGRELVVTEEEMWKL